ncbi:MAG TPA: antibiotic biosynthesis monooxygenase [Acidimicrobiales bacterium]|nr:antibiotic biosynthesis monooxygenase [Acidimicrobiales bacterium]
MIIIAGWIEVDPKDRDAFLDSRLDAVLATRSEKGCIEYVFAADPIELGRVRVFERWESLADLEAHVALMRSGPSSRPPYALVGRELHRYTVSDSAPLD